MKRLLIFAFALALMPIGASALSVNYDIVVGDFGDSFVAVNIGGSGELTLPMPVDFEGLNVEGALFAKTETGDLALYIGETKSASVAYETSIYTAKTGKIWTFSAYVPAGIAKDVNVYLPKDADISNVQPSGKTEQLKDSEKIIWQLGPSQTEVSANYVMASEPRTAVGNAALLFIAILILVGIFGTVVFLKQDFFKKVEAPQPVIKKEKKAEKGDGSRTSKGKKDVIKTLTGNETKIVELLIESRGTIKRNRLELASGIAKSSLAAALANLERRNVVQIDKARTVHVVEFTEWFRKL